MSISQYLIVIIVYLIVSCVSVSHIKVEGRMGLNPSIDYW